MQVRLLLIIASLFLAACSSQDTSETKQSTEKAYYEAAQRALKTSNWDLAITHLQGLEEYFPFGVYAEQAQLELIYAYYRNFEPEASTASADRFIRLHPQHHNVDYAYYMKGLTSFTESSGMFERFIPTDLTMRDPGSARQSFAHFSQLLARFPKSTYAGDARKRMIYLRNLLARYEIHVANYYIERGAYVGAANRGRYVTENFQQTPAIPDALAVMIQSYHHLNLVDLGDNAVATLKQNYPEHPALNEDGTFNYEYSSRQAETTWLSTLSFGLFDKDDPQGFDSRGLYNPEYAYLKVDPETGKTTRSVKEDRTFEQWMADGLDWLTFDKLNPAKQNQNAK
jgi:outer membrane protein assembly factor BamD